MHPFLFSYTQPFFTNSPLSLTESTWPWEQINADVVNLHRIMQFSLKICHLVYKRDLYVHRQHEMKDSFDMLNSSLWEITSFCTFFSLRNSKIKDNGLVNRKKELLSETFSDKKEQQGFLCVQCDLRNLKVKWFKQSCPLHSL